MDEVFKQPLISNPHIPHPGHEDLNINVLVGGAMALAWFKRSQHKAHNGIHNNLLMNIPWDLGAVPLKIVLGD
jgi:hypothetical protein